MIVNPGSGGDPDRHWHLGRDPSQELLTLRGLVDLFSVALQPDALSMTQTNSHGPAAPADAPHRRLAAKLSSGVPIAPEDVATWFETVHHDAMGAHKTNCSAVLIGSNGEPMGVDDLPRERHNSGRYGGVLVVVNQWASQAPRVAVRSRLQWLLLSA